MNEINEYDDVDVDTREIEIPFLNVEKKNIFLALDFLDFSVANIDLI